MTTLHDLASRVEIYAPAISAVATLLIVGWLVFNAAVCRNNAERIADLERDFREFRKAAGKPVARAEWEGLE